MTLRGLGGSVTLDEAVAGGSGGIEIAGRGVDFLGALTTTGGNVSVNSSGAAAAVTGTSSATVTTESGAVTIAGQSGVSLEADVVSAGTTNAAGQGLRGGQVSVSTQSGAISLAGIDSRGGASSASGSVGGTGGAIGISAGGGVGLPTLVNGDLLAGGGAGPSAAGRGPGGAIEVNSPGFSGDTTLAGDIETNGSFVDLRGAYVTARGKITTTGGRVTLRGYAGAVLQKAVSAGSGGIDIQITYTGGGLVGLGGPLVTSGGDVDIRGGIGITVTDFLGAPSSSPMDASITTTAAPDSGQRSGRSDYQCRWREPVFQLDRHVGCGERRRCWVGRRGGASDRVERPDPAGRDRRAGRSLLGARVRRRGWGLDHPSRELLLGVPLRGGHDQWARRGRAALRGAVGAARRRGSGGRRRHGDPWRAGGRLLPDAQGGGRRHRPDHRADRCGLRARDLRHRRSNRHDGPGWLRGALRRRDDPRTAGRNAQRQRGHDRGYEQHRHGLGGRECDDLGAGRVRRGVGDRYARRRRGRHGPDPSRWGGRARRRRHEQHD